MTEEYYPTISAATDWDAGMAIEVTVSTEYEPLTLEVVKSQLAATLLAAGFTDEQVNFLVGE